MEELKSLVTDILTDRKKLVPGVIATVSLAVGIRQLLKYSRSGVVTQCDSHYDFVIGSAGCVLANRLSASGKFKVLLIEAGDEETKYPAIPVPLLASQACTEPDAMWQDLTAPQDNCQAYKDQRSYTQHGKVLGGGSSVNWMIYARGHRDDYDSWEQKGCEGWGWDNVKEYFKKMENYFMRDRDDLGHRGPLTVSLNNTYRICDLLIEASAELGVPENPCYNSGVNNVAYFMQYRILLCKGATKSHTTIRNGERCSTAKAYLRPAMSRSNLHVITNAHVTKLCT
ncbi:hypothetical protein EB796_003564 [Bugula neritina]|uniref:Glucose-methanol-choline oxidoreductase N-terminal domain-containing protein n=1 Tax=Bugula neritina TaxID=10212 RepID=A0A7J7KIS7_BUGNE|nr:hypothetical protein EB796_003564 [Bugula neritina]